MKKASYTSPEVKEVVFELDGAILNGIDSSTPNLGPTSFGWRDELFEERGSGLFENLLNRER